MIKELIETERNLRKEADSYQKTIFDKLKTIFSIIKAEYLDKEKIIHSKELVLNFGHYSTLDGYRIDDNYLYLNYMDIGYDCYDCAEFKIPLEVVEKELQSKGAVLNWYKGEIDKYIEEQKELKRKKEVEKEKKELAELKRLQEKYKGKL